MTTRRDFFRYGAAAALAFTGLQRHLNSTFIAQETGGPAGYGAITRNASGILDLPPGFSYQVISRAGERMDDGFVVPAAHDGMGAFNGPNGTTILVRNHELSFSDLDSGPFGRGASLRS